MRRGFCATAHKHFAFVIDEAPLGAYVAEASRPDGRPLIGGGKSGLHGDTVPDNARRGRPQGKRHRKQTACGFGRAARVKRCGKSAPRGPATGAAWQAPPGARPNRGDATAARPCEVRLRTRRPGWLLEAAGNGRPRGMAVTRAVRAPYRTRLTGRLATLSVRDYESATDFRRAL